MNVPGKSSVLSFTKLDYVLLLYGNTNAIFFEFAFNLRDHERIINYCKYKTGAFSTNCSELNNAL